MHVIKYINDPICCWYLLMFLAKAWSEFFFNLTLCKQGFLKGLAWGANLFKNCCVNFGCVKINVLSSRKISMPRYVFVCFKSVIFTYFFIWTVSFFGCFGRFIEYKQVIYMDNYSNIFINKYWLVNRVLH